MKFSILLATVTSLLISSGNAWMCNKGWSGDGSCEAAGRWTFCCMAELNNQYLPYHEFEHPKLDGYRQRTDIAQRCGTKEHGYVVCAH